MGYEYEEDGTINRFPWMEPATEEDESGFVQCSKCNGWIKFENNEYFCPYCGNERMTRKEFFNYIGAHLYTDKCLNNCDFNYPLCRGDCEWYEKETGIFV